eukprot:scaffold68261_cov69-Phaeocystis_antarctica.AAC.3
MSVVMVGPRDTTALLLVAVLGGLVCLEEIGRAHGAARLVIDKSGVVLCAARSGLGRIQKGVACQACDVI